MSNHPNRSSRAQELRNSRGEVVTLAHDAGSRWRLTAYTLTPWGTGPFTAGSDYGGYAAMKAEFDRITAKLPA